MISAVFMRLNRLSQAFLPQSLFGRLFGLVALAVLASHVLFAVQLSFRQGRQNLGPPLESKLPAFEVPGTLEPLPELLMPVEPLDTVQEPRDEALAARPGRRLAPDRVRKPRSPYEARNTFQPYGTLFWLGLAAQCLLMLGVARWGSRMLTQPIEHLAEGAIALGDNLQNPPLFECGPLEVRMAIRGFNQMQIKLKHQLAERSQFLLAVSHDLRTPLTRMRLRYEQLPEGDLQQKLLQDWKDLSRLVDSTLDYVRGQEVQKDPVLLDVEALLSAAVEDRQDMGQAISLMGSAKPITTRPDALRRCLQNLLDNAISYGEQAQIELIDSDSALVISIRDFGPGIPEAELHRVMEPFVRLEASRNRHTGGLGLGLSIARDSARSALGRLTLANHLETGLVARIELQR